MFVSIAIWVPFYFRLGSVLGWGLDFGSGMMTIWKNYDGPNYLIIAKTFYDKKAIGTQFSNPIGLDYYPAHLPLYPTIISLLGNFLSGTKAMLLATLLGTGMMFGTFYLYLKNLGVRQAGWISILLLWLPARFLAVRSVGSPESWFMLFILGSLWAFRKKKYLAAGLIGSLAQMTKSPGILLFAGYILFFVFQAFKSRKLEVKEYLRAVWIFLIPLAALGVFVFYWLRVGDFWAYFHSGDNFHLFWPPFSVFTPNGVYWTGNYWLEEFIWVWLIYGVGIARLWKKDLRVEAIFGSVFFASTLFIAHRDIARYILPIAPLALIGWKEMIVRKEFKIIALILIVPTLLFTWQFLLNNTAPVADWAPYL